MFKSLEIPHKRAYLDINNRSIESTTEHKLLEKKLKVELKESKHKPNHTYGNLYGKQSFSLNRFKLK
jgi:hypothetical protein